MATKNVTRRAMIAGLFSLALPLSVNAQSPLTANAQGYSRQPRTLEPATETNQTLREAVYSSAEMIKRATVRVDRESYISKEETPYGFDFNQRATGILLHPVNSGNTYLASCNHIWDLDMDPNKGIEKTLEAAAEKGVINPRKEDIIKRMKVLGYTVPPSKGFYFEKERDLSVLDVTDLMPSLKELATPFPIDVRKPISHGIGDKVFWLNPAESEFPLVEAHVLRENVFFSDKKFGGVYSVENIETDGFLGCESGKPVFNIVNGQPVFAGIITGRIANTKNGKPMNRVTFSSARNIIDAIGNYEKGK